MSFLEAIGRVKVGVWQFIRLVFNANIDLPYHDYEHRDEETTVLAYVVGKNNQDANGSQAKLFVSKNTMIYCTEDTTVRFNDRHNVAVAILANTWYTFYSNIYMVFTVAITEGEDLYMYFEGTFPYEGRNPE